MLSVSSSLWICSCTLVTLVKHTPCAWTIALRLLVLSLLLIHTIKCFIAILISIKWHWKHKIILKYRGIVFNVIVVVWKEAIMLMRVIESTCSRVRPSCKAVVLNTYWLMSCNTVVACSVVVIAILKTLIASPISSVCKLIAKFRLLLWSIYCKYVLIYFLCNKCVASYLIVGSSTQFSFISCQIYHSIILVRW